jgi:type III secretion protein J
MLNKVKLNTRPALRAMGLAAMLVLTGCQSELYSDLSERQANDVIRALSEVGIASQRAGGGDGKFSVSVDRSDFGTAVTELSARGLPKQDYSSLGTVFSADKLVSTPFEERARFMHALNEELSHSITKIAGVSSAKVHVMIPESEGFRQKTSRPRAAVFIYASPESQVHDDVPKIKNLIVNSLDGMLYENVEVAIFETASTVQVATRTARSNLLFNSSLLLVLVLLMGIGAYLLRRLGSGAPSLAAKRIAK